MHISLAPRTTQRNTINTMLSTTRVSSTRNDVLTWERDKRRTDIDTIPKALDFKISTLTASRTYYQQNENKPKERHTTPAHNRSNRPMQQSNTVPSSQQLATPAVASLPPWSCASPHHAWIFRALPFVAAQPPSLLSWLSRLQNARANGLILLYPAFVPVCACVCVCVCVCVKHTRNAYWTK